MPRGPIWNVGLVSALMLSCLHAPVIWSPDGRWLAYTMAVQPGSRMRAPWWLFETEPPARSDREPVRPKPRAAAVAYRLWATRAETGESVLLEGSRGPLTSPGWSPDGRALAFGRLVPEPDGRARFEIVVQDGPGRQRVLLSRPHPELDAKAADLPVLAPAWSPDGRYLAVPWFQQTLSLAIVRADNGRVLKPIDDACWPAWSPDKTMLAFVHGGDPESLQCLDTNFGPSRHLADIGPTSQSPVWSHDGRSLVVVAGVSAPPPGLGPMPGPRSKPTAAPPGPVPSQQAKLIRVDVASGKVETVASVTPDPIGRDEAFCGAWFSCGRDGEDLFFTSDVEGQPTVITWFRPRSGETYKRFHPIDHSIRIGALAVDPNGRLLALRVGPPGDPSPPALCDLTTDRVVPLVPDDAARVEWLTTLIGAARELLRFGLPAASIAGRTVDRAALLPIPGEFPATHEVSSRLRRLGRLGRPICDRTAEAPPADPSLSALLDEAKLFFDYLREDYAAAYEDLDALEARAVTPDQRLRLLSVRAQVFLGLGRTDRAAQTIAFLNETAPSSRRRLEMTPAGPAMSAEPASGEGWPSYLAQQAGELEKAKGASSRPDEPLGHRDPGAPDPMIGPAPAPPFAPLIEPPAPHD
ncbi:MAG: biopolymer transporter Tol, partial [Planctomycetaceae bacterium]